MSMNSREKVNAFRDGVRKGLNMAIGQEDRPRLEDLLKKSEIQRQEALSGLHNGLGKAAERLYGGGGS